MNKILLINRLNPQDFTNKKKKVCFIIGGMNVPSMENKLVDLLNKSDLLERKDIFYKYNGVELNISTQQIPIVVKLLTTNNIPIYNIYQVYDPDL